MNRTKLYWLSQIGGWSLYFLSQVFFILLANRSSSAEMITTIVTSGLVGLVLSIATSHVYRYFIKRWNWLQEFTIRIIPKVILMSILLGSLTYCYIILASILFGNFDINRDFTTALIVINIFGYGLLYFFWSMIYFMYHYVDSYNKALKYEASISEFRLNKLKSQLNPHFIFNGLNSIRALVDENPIKAKSAITQLSNILRNSLAMDKQELIQFPEEMKTVRDYLELESIRFEERLQFEMNIESGSEKYLVPPMMIQTLVENGIKHGISTLVEGGKIRIDTKIEAGALNIKIRNDGQLVNGSLYKKEGYGLENTKQRLRLIFGDKSGFNISNENGNTVLTEVKIPQIKSST